MFVSDCFRGERSAFDRHRAQHAGERLGKCFFAGTGRRHDHVQSVYRPRHGDIQQAERFVDGLAQPNLEGLLILDRQQRANVLGSVPADASIGLVGLAADRHLRRVAFQTSFQLGQHYHVELQPFGLVDRHHANHRGRRILDLGSFDEADKLARPDGPAAIERVAQFDQLPQPIHVALATWAESGPIQA